MAITSAKKGAIVPASDLQDLDLNDLTNTGVISPREGGKSFEFLQNYGENPNEGLFSGGQLQAVLPGVFSSNNNPVSSTNDIRDGETLNTSNATKLLEDIGTEATSVNEQVDSFLATSLYSGSTEGAESASELDALRKSLGITSEEEKQRIGEAGSSAYDEYLPMIQEAEKAKRQGMPKATIGAGERGGFMSTQFAGRAALQTTEGETFVGEGGELNRIKSDYDQVIINAKARAMAAKSAAENAARIAIKTGKQQDLNNALAMRQQFQSESRDAITLANQKSDAISNFLTEQREGIKFEQSQEDRLLGQATDKLNFLLESADETAFEQNRQAIVDLMTDAGFEGVEINSLIDSFKEKARIANKKDIPTPELRTVDGSLYSVEYDEKTGEFTTNLLIKKAPGGGGDPKITNASRTADIKAFLKENNLQGEDKKVSWENYLNMQQTWVNNGGNSTTFKTNFPIGQWMDVDNIKEYNLRITGE